MSKRILTDYTGSEMAYKQGFEYMRLYDTASWLISGQFAVIIADDNLFEGL